MNSVLHAIKSLKFEFVKSFYYLEKYLPHSTVLVK